MSIATKEYAQTLDRQFPGHRDLFEIPTLGGLGAKVAVKDPSQKDEPGLYFCGNSLGLMPKASEHAVMAEMAAWKTRAVVAHFDHPTAHPWVTMDEPVSELLAPIVGSSDAGEVAVMNTLTGNLHSLFAAFYKPTASRYKVLFEANAFPSDTYALQGQVQLHGYKHQDALISMAPREGEYTLRTEDIIDIINRDGDSIAVVMFPGIQYYSGQLFDIAAITKAARAKGCVVGWDLAHAVGNVPLKLHDWQVDFAVFCTYKYLNSGPGAIGGLFVHSKHATDGRPRLSGWWGNRSETRFAMATEFDPSPGAAGFKMSNPTVISVACVRESLKIFKLAGGVEGLRARSQSLTGYLRQLLQNSKHYVPISEGGSRSVTHFTIITPEKAGEHGAQLSLKFFGDGVMDKVFQNLVDVGVIGDERRPDVIRLAPNHLYNTHEEVLRVSELFETACDTVN